MFKQIFNGKLNFFLIPAAIIIASVIISGGIIFKNRVLPKTIDYDASRNTLPLANSFAPYFALKTTDGNEVSLTDLTGQNVLLVFWSVNCSFSAKELWDLKKFTDAYRGKISVIAIMYKDSQESVRQYKEKENINFTILSDANGEVAEKYKIAGTPAHFFINQQGKITAVVPDYTPFDALMIHAREMFN
jgi:peroxiredoxin Q/BCP